MVVTVRADHRCNVDESALVTVFVTRQHQLNADMSSAGLHVLCTDNGGDFGMCIHPFDMLGRLRGVLRVFCSKVTVQMVATECVCTHSLGARTARYFLAFQ